MGRWTVGPAVLAICAALAPGAQAEKTVGSNLASPADGGVCAAVPLAPPSHACTESIAGLAPVDAAIAPTVPSDGVIVRWRIKRGDGQPFTVPASLRVIRANTGVASSAEVTIPAQAGTYEFGTRLAVRAGDQIGVDLRAVPFLSNVNVAHAGAPAEDLLDEWTAPLGTGATEPPDNDNVPGVELLLNADVEADVDGDGYGDESQDACPQFASTQLACEFGAPDTTITAKPKRRTTERRATFAFVSTRPGVSFQCSLDGGAYRPCESPKRYRVATGEHFVLIRALEGEIPDPTPAAARWAVRKRKRR